MVESIKHTEELLERIDNTYIDTAYMEMLNGFNELRTYQIVEIVRDIWKFAACNPICDKDVYKKFMYTNIGNRLLYIRCMYTKYADELQNDMVEFLNKKFIKADYYDKDNNLIKIEPNFEYRKYLLKTDGKYDYNVLKNVDIYEDSNEMTTKLKQTYIDSWKSVYAKHAESFKRKYGYKLSDVENWSYEQWESFAEKCREDNIRPIDLKVSENYVEREAHRPLFNKTIKMIDAETDEVYERFDNRSSVIEMIGIKKNRLSACIKSSKENPNCKSLWSKYKYNEKKYWFVEE